MDWYRRWTDRQGSSQLFMAGFWGRTVFDALCDISAERDFGGIIPRQYADAGFLVRHLGLEHCDFQPQGGPDIRGEIIAKALAKIIEVKLIIEKGDVFVIDGWERRQPKLPRKSTDRVRKHRDSLKKTATKMKQHETRFTMFPNVSETHETHIEKEKEKEREKEKEKEKETRKRINAADAASVFLKMQEDWNARAGALLPRCEKRTEQRVRAASSFLKANGDEAFARLLEKVNASDFLSGRASDFKASFDWALKPANATKILEGNYDSSRLAKPANMAAPKEPPKTVQDALRAYEQKAPMVWGPAEEKRDSGPRNALETISGEGT